MNIEMSIHKIQVEVNIATLFIVSLLSVLYIVHIAALLVAPSCGSSVWYLQLSSSTLMFTG